MDFLTKHKPRRTNDGAMLYVGLFSGLVAHSCLFLNALVRFEESEGYSDGRHTSNDNGGKPQ